MFPATRHAPVIPGESRLLHGGDYNPDQWLHAPAILDEDFRLMPLARCHTFSVGIFAWTALEPEEGRFTFAWLDRLMDRHAAAGHRVILATPSGARPAWLARRHPEVLRVLRDGRRAAYGDRHNHCWTSPAYRERVRSINEALATRYANHPALGMWHISNEYNGECLCPLCRAAFQHWLQQRHGSLETLNEAWWTAFWSHQLTRWDEIEPTDFVCDGMMLDWMRFTSWQVADFLRWEVEPLRRLTPGVPVTTNFMGLFPHLDYARLAAEVDVVADDQYPRYDPGDPEVLGTIRHLALKHDLLRAAKRRPFFLMESCPGAVQWKTPQRLKRPGVHRFEMLQALAHGADGTCYFQWRAGRGGSEKLHGSVVGHDGTEHARTFRETAAWGRALESLQAVRGTCVEPRVALLFDWESRWAQKFSSGTGADDWRYVEVATEFHAPFWARGIAVDVVCADADLAPYALVVAPQLWIMTPAVAARWRAFVAAGGTLVATWDTAMADASNRMLLGGWPGEGLTDLFGVRIEEMDRCPRDETRRLVAAPGCDLGTDPRAREVFGVGAAAGGEVLATYGEEFYAGAPALVRRRHGPGAAWYAAARFDVPTLDAWLGGLAEALGLPRALDAALPAGVTAQVRGAGAERFLFVLNGNNRPVTVALGSRSGTCAETGEPVAGTLDLAAFDGRVLRLASA